MRLWFGEDICYILDIADVLYCQEIFGVDFSIPFKYMKLMRSEIQKVLFSATKDLLRRIDDFRFANRINSRSEAMRRLLEEALKKYEKRNKK